MIAVISPAKSLDFTDPDFKNSTEPEFKKDTAELISILKKYTATQIRELMSLSDNLADLNHKRYQEFDLHDPNNAKQALLAFKGDVYTGFDLDHYDKDDFEFAQQHLRILSGLYGLLRPLDLIQPYRLEMGTSLSNERGKNLYEFWGDRIARHLRDELTSHKSKTIINLASSEYWKSVDEQTLGSDIRVKNIIFKDFKDGKYKIIGIYAKKARGLMSDFMVRNRIDKPEDLKSFDEGGYLFQQDMSTENNWVFTRKNI